MTFGGGDGGQYNCWSRDADVVAHEIMHGITEKGSNLHVSYESGVSLS
jgi:Zn-dependent metalloprotease